MLSFVTLPPGCKAWFVGEGSANAVFGVELPEGDPRKDEVEGKLLRVPKVETKGFSCEQLQKYWEAQVKPLFTDDELVQQSLVRLTGSDIIPQLNEILAVRDKAGSRRPDHANKGVKDVEYGMLVEDMSMKLSAVKPALVLEFKPKWLSQSPNAPLSAIRCRNCAREAWRNNKLARNKPIWCPLSLVNAQNKANAQTQPGSDDIEYTINGIAGGTELDEASRKVVGHWLSTNTLIPKLKSLQTSLDPSGPRVARQAVFDSKLQLAMTLRDCSCFLRLCLDGQVEAKLADTDEKNWEDKLPYWQQTEVVLEEQGYYQGTEEPRQVTACRLRPSNSQ